jgi:hypothetical protein
MKFIFISTLLLLFTSCASSTTQKQRTSQFDNIPISPSAIESNQNIEVSQLGF